MSAPPLTVHGTQVHFPFEPYPSQHVYIGKVIEALKSGCHAVLESPTGTGKTLCLLTAVLSWRQDFVAEVRHNLQHGNQTESMASVPRIIYASRTHSQLSQVVRELKRMRESGYDIKMSVLGGRSGTCIHPKISKEPNQLVQQAMCRSYCKAKKCHYKNQLDKMGEVKIESLGGVIDIEELVSWGTEKQVCPYYLGRQLTEKADILLIPYNYLFDDKMRKRHKIEVANKIIIVDEAHNVESVCEDSFSLSLNSTELAGAIRECDDLAAVYETITEGTNQEESNSKPLQELHDLYQRTAVLKSNLLDLEKSITVNFGAAATINGQSSVPIELYMVFRGVNLVPQSAESAMKLSATVEEIQQTLADRATGTKGQKLNKLVDICQFFAGLNDEKLEESMAAYSLFVQAEKKKKEWIETETPVGTSKPIQLNLWCFDSSKAVHAILRDGARNIIFTSGTLAPLPEYIAQVGLDCCQKEPVTLLGEHVISPDQLMVSALTRTSGGAELKNVYSNRENASMFSGMGDALKSIKQFSPGGMLIFHPTYTLMNIANKFWRTTDERTCKNRQNVFQRKVFNEPTKRGEMEAITKEYEQSLIENVKEGAVFQGVCRGKVSEGVDFADDRGRVCCITGIPYAPYQDPRIKLKKAYLVAQRGPKAGDEWYQIQAIRAVNQAIGRIIRHKNDFGAIIFLDARFSYPATRALLPKWIGGKLKVHNDPILLAKGIRAFFNKMAAYQRSGKLAPTKEIVTFSGGFAEGKQPGSKKTAKLNVFKPQLTIKDIATEIKQQRETTSLFSQTSPAKASSIFSSMESAKTTSTMHSQCDGLTKRKLPSDSSPVQATKKRKKIKIKRADDNLVSQVLDGDTAKSDSSFQMHHQQNLEPESDVRLRFICYDALTQFDEAVKLEPKTFMRVYMKTVKTLFFRAGLASQFDAFNQFTIAHVKKTKNWVELEGLWNETWIEPLATALGGLLSQMVIAGLIEIYNKPELTSRFSKEHTSELAVKNVAKWMSNIKCAFDRTKTRLMTTKVKVETCKIATVSWETKIFLPKFMKFIKKVLFEENPRSEPMTDVKSALLELMKTKELNEKIFASIAHVANLFKADGLDVYVMCGCLGILTLTPTVHAQFKSRVALYLGMSLGDELIECYQRRIFNCQF